MPGNCRSAPCARSSAVRKLRLAVGNGGDHDVSVGRSQRLLPMFGALSPTSPKALARAAMPCRTAARRSRASLRNAERAKPLKCERRANPRIARGALWMRRRWQRRCSGGASARVPQSRSSMRKMMYVAANGEGRGRSTPLWMSSELKRRRRAHFVARFLQKRSRLSSPPKRVVKIVESARKMSPARSPDGGIHRNMLNSRLPASVNGCGRDMSTG